MIDYFILPNLHSFLLLVLLSKVDSFILLRYPRMISETFPTRILGLLLLYDRGMLIVNLSSRLLLLAQLAGLLIRFHKPIMVNMQQCILVGLTPGISRPDRYVPLFGERIFEPSKMRESTPIVDQLRALKKVVDQGKV